MQASTSSLGGKLRDWAASDQAGIPKALIELSVARDLKSNKNNIYMHMGNKWKTTENVSPLWKETGYLITQNNEKVEVLNDVFVSL